MSIKEAALTEKDDQLQQLHAKLHQLSTDSEKERKQLQTVLAKMEKHLSTTTEELNQERSVRCLRPDFCRVLTPHYFSKLQYFIKFRWNLAREKSRVDALQASLEEERKGASEKAASDWVRFFSFFFWRGGAEGF